MDGPDPEVSQGRTSAVNAIFCTRLRWSVGGRRDYSCRKSLSLGVLLLTVRAGEGGVVLLTGGKDKMCTPAKKKDRLCTPAGVEVFEPAIKGQLGLFLALLVILLLIILGSRVEREIYQPRLALVRRQRILDR